MNTTTKLDAKKTAITFTIKRVKVGEAYPRNGNFYKGGTPRYSWVVMLGDRPCSVFSRKRHAREFINVYGDALRAEFRE